MRLPLFAVAAMAVWPLGAAAQDAAAVDRGAAVFNQWCAPCHAAGPGAEGRRALPGTLSLDLKYKGEKPALLEKRNDLPAPVLKTFIRGGSFSMPPFRKTEVSDADIETIAAYLQFSAGRGR